MTTTRAALAAALLTPLLTGCLTFPTYTTTTASYSSALVEVSRPKETKARWGAVETIVLGDSSRYVYEDSMIKVAIGALTNDVEFLIANKTDHSIKIIWDEATFVDVSGKVMRVMHAGVKYADRNQAQPPSVIPAHQTIEDLAEPTDRVYFSTGTLYTPGDWKHLGLVTPQLAVTQSNMSTIAITPEATFTAQAKANVGKRMGLILPLQIEGVTNEYTFWFKITDATVSGRTTGR
jgi:hypothetical protein